MTHPDIHFLGELETVIRNRLAEKPEQSYTASLAAAGIPRVAQKLGEEAVELALASVVEQPREELVGEAADLLYHLMVLLAVKEIPFGEVCARLEKRHRIAMNVTPEGA